MTTLFQKKKIAVTTATIGLVFILATFTIVGFFPRVIKSDDGVPPTLTQTYIERSEKQLTDVWPPIGEPIFSIQYPKYWVAEKSQPYTSVNGATISKIAVMAQADQGARISKSVLIRRSNIPGIFGLPEKLKNRLSNDDFINWYIDQESRSFLDFKVIKTKKDTLAGEPVYVIESKYISSDRYNENQIEYFLFRKDLVYHIEASYISQVAESRPTLEKIVGSLKFFK